MIEALEGCYVTVNNKEEREAAQEYFFSQGIGYGDRGRSYDNDPSIFAFIVLNGQLIAVRSGHRTRAGMDRVSWRRFKDIKSSVGV